MATNAIAALRRSRPTDRRVPPPVRVRPSVTLQPRGLPQRSLAFIRAALLEWSHLVSRV